MKILAFLSALLASFSAHAQACDCSKTIGMCTAAFKIENITGAKEGKAYAADVILISSQPRCSKISFYVDHTPYISVLNNSNTATENIFGTSAISKNSVSIDYCRICAAAQAPDGGQASPEGNAMTQRFNGALLASFDKDAETRATAARANTDLTASQSGGMLEIINALGAMQGILQHAKVRGNASAPSNDPVVQSLKRQMNRMPRECASNPAAPGCPYHTNPKGYGPSRN